MKETIKIALLLVAFMVTLGSCKKNEKLKHEDVKSKNGSTLFSGDGEFDILGYGYDVTGEYLASESVSKAAVIDAKRFKVDYPNRVSAPMATHGSSKHYTGATAIDFIKDINNQREFKASFTAGTKDPAKDSGQYFTGSINHKRTDQNIYSYSSKYSFSHSEEVYRLKKAYFTDDVTLAMLKNYLTPEFLANVSNYSAEALVNMYGTHVLLDISLGGRMSIEFSASVISETTTVKKVRTTEGALGFLAKKFGINVSSNMTNEEMTKSFNESRDRKMSLSFVGGQTSGRAITIDQNGNVSESINIGVWQQSLNPSNCVLVDIVKAIPIWEFVADPVKSDLLKAAVKKHIADKQIKELGEAPVHAYYSPSMNVWRYEFNPENIAYLQDGSWENKGVYFHAFKEQKPGTVPVYEFYAPSTQDCTWSQGNLTSSYWQNAGVKFYAYPVSQSTNSPIYSYYHHKSRRSHFLGTDPGKPSPQNEWTNEGIAFYAL